MSKKQRFIATRLFILLVTAISLIFSTAALIHLSLASIHVEYERCAAAELHRAESASPNGPSETWEEKQSNIKNEFSDGSWAIKLVSGNIDKDVSVMIYMLIGVSFSASLVGGYWIYKKSR